jgi:hypothetical protein
VAPPRPPVKGGATAGIGRRAYSPNPRFGLRLAAVGFGGACGPPGCVLVSSRVSAMSGGTLGASGVASGDSRVACDLR